jgi:hypothetical protein
LAPVEGIEPPLTVLETVALPLYYTGVVWWTTRESNPVYQRSQIYSLLQSPMLLVVRVLFNQSIYNIIEKFGWHVNTIFLGF